MDTRGLRTLEYSKIINMLEKKAATSLGKDLVKKLAPSSDLEQATYMQQETREGTDAIRLKGGLPLGGIKDIHPSLKRLKIGGDLTAEQLLEISNTIYAGTKVKRFVNKLGENAEIPILKGHADSIIELKQIEDSINRCINEYAEIVDTASSTLKAIRNQLRTLEGRIKEKLDQILRNTSNQKMLQEAIVTIRNGRYVIPVKQEYRGAFGGMIHDQSASGATLFIEPQAVVQINNEIKEQLLKEEKELERILKELSNLVREETDTLATNIEHLGKLDFIQAKADLANSMKAIKPKLNNKGIIQLKKARHPLISIEDVVPIDIQLGLEFSSIVITGPNTGGKTVTLKTIGLLSIMAMSGLHVPAEEDSELSTFSSVYADIGDEQSIEQSLSTFSSHLTNIIRILQEMDKDSLVLFDELGAGTDPTEGAALAISILEKVREVGAKVVATTHYSDLKAYAYNREDVINASVEFDIETLRPTYRLLIGVPGRSNAFAIAKRLGLSDEIIEFAKNQISEDNLQVETMIETLEVSQRTAEKERLIAEELRKEAENLTRELERKMDSFENQKEALYESAREKAEVMVQKARREAEAIIADLRNLAQEEQAGIKEHKLIEMKKRLDEAVPERKTKGTKKVKKNQKLEVGDDVKVLSVGQKGSIIEKVTEKEYVVQIGIIKMKLDIADLQLIESTNKASKPTAFTSVKRESGVRSELDVRGSTVEDAIMSIDQYLDHAFMEGYKQVSIIHGKGTGALRAGLQDFFRKHPHVKNARLGQFSEGGSGVTVLELK